MALVTADQVVVERIGRVADPCGKPAVGDIDAAVGYNRSRVARADGRAPADRRAVGGKSLDDAGLAPNRVAVGAEPLRPVIGVNRVADQQQCADSARTKAPT